MSKDFSVSSEMIIWFLFFNFVDVVYHLQSFTSSFPVWIPFISFSSLIAVARTSKTMLNKRGESGHPCLAPDLRGNAFSFSPLSTILAVSLSYMTFIMLR